MTSHITPKHKVFVLTATLVLLVATIVSTVAVVVRKLPQSKATHVQDSYLFDARVVLPTGKAEVIQETAADYNGDGIQDIAVTTGDGSLLVYTGTGGGFMSAPTEYAIGEELSYVRTGLINADALPDIVVLRQTFIIDVFVIQAVLMINDGVGGFEAPVYYELGSAVAPPLPSMLILTDLNIDGSDDIVIAGNSAISAYTNDGSGSFSAPSSASLSGSIGISDIAAGLLDGDAYPDIAFANTHALDVSIGVVLNDGSGGLGANTQYAVTDLPRNLDIADVDEDGNNDVVAGIHFAGVSVNFGDGTGALVSEDVYTATSYSSVTDVVSLADLTGDGAPEILSAQSNTDTLTVFINNGAGIYDAGTNYNSGWGVRQSVSFPDESGRLVVGDFNGDGVKDITYPMKQWQANANISLVFGNSDGSLAMAPFFETGTTVPSAGWSPVSVAAADFNSDELLDVVTANRWGSDTSVLLALTPGTFDSALNIPTADGPRQVVTGDLNDDGFQDYLSMNTDDSSLSTVLGNGDGTFDPPVTEALGFFPQAIALGNFDGDPFPDLGVTGNAPPSSHFFKPFLNDGDGTFTENASYGLCCSLSGAGVAITLGDIDNDTILDAVVAHGSGTINLFFGVGDGTFTSVGGDTVGSGFTLSYVLADISGDTFLDLLVAERDTNLLAVWVNDGTGHYGGAPVATYPTGLRPRNIDLGDVNLDGDLDAVIGHAGENTVGIMFGNGDGTFDGIVHYGTGSFPHDTVVYDFTQDGRTDVLSADGFGGSLHTVSLLSNLFTAPGLVVTESGGSTDVIEGGATDSFTVHLATMPSALVIVSLTLDNGQSSISPTELVFTPANFSTPQTVTVSATNDSVTEGAHASIVTATASGDEHDYAGLTAQVTVNINDAGGEQLIRIEGDDPVALAQNVSRYRFADGEADTAIIATKDRIVDALVSTSLAARTNATLLVTDPATLSPGVLEELNRALGSTSKKIYIAGGIEAIPEAIATELSAAGFTNQHRFAGETRDFTAALIADEVVALNPMPTRTVLVSENRAFADTLGTSSAAGNFDEFGNVMPYVLVERGSTEVTAPTADFLSRHQDLTSIVTIGGPVAIAPAARTAIQALVPAAILTGYEGANRFGTNEQFNAAYFDTPSTVVVAPGEAAQLPGAITTASSGGVGFFGALLAGTIGADELAPTVLVRANSIPAENLEYLTPRAASITKVIVTGGLQSVSAEVEQQLRDLLLSTF